MIRFVAILLLWPTLTLANPYPAFFDVTGVAPNDVLNVREAPTAVAEIVSEIAPEATDIEVVDQDATSRWAQINLGESSGWVAIRYLRAQPPTGDYNLTRKLSCSGTEPFWDLDITQGLWAKLTTPTTTQNIHGIGLLQTAVARSGRFSLRGNGLTVIMRREVCSDGMSDRAYGLDVDMLFDTLGGTAHFNGCCNLVAD